MDLITTSSFSVFGSATESTPAARFGVVTLVLVATSCTFAPDAFAALPTLSDAAPASGQAWMQWMRDNLGYAIGVIALVLAAFGFLAVAGGALHVFQEWRQGRKELGDLKVYVIVGIMLVVFIVFLVTQGSGVIQTSQTIQN